MNISRRGLMASLLSLIGVKYRQSKPQRPWTEFANYGDDPLADWACWKCWLVTRMEQLGASNTVFSYETAIDDLDFPTSVALYSIMCELADEVAT